MKTFGTFLLLLMLGAPAVAQSETKAEPSMDGTHGLSVIKTNWSQRFYIAGLDEDPLRTATGTLQIARERKETPRPTTSARRGATPPPRPAPTPIRDVQGGIDLRESRDYYVYEVKVLNHGTKKIKSLEWDYVLFDPSTQREVGRHSFETKAGIALGKGKTLVGMSTLPPVTVLDVSKLKKEALKQFTARVDILRVVYEDGAVWERPQEK